MKKFYMTFFPLLGLVIVTIGVIAMSPQFTNAQSNNSSNVASSLANYTKLFSEDKEFQQCLDFMPDQCFPIVTVLYESPTFIALQSEYVNSIWKAVDLVEKDGYKIQGLTSYSLTSDLGLSSKNYVNLLVVLSKNNSN